MRNRKMKFCFALCAFVLLATICNRVTGQSTDTDLSRASSKCPKGYEKTNRRCFYNMECDSGVGICKGGRCCKKKKNPHKNNCPHGYKETNRNCRKDRDCGYDGICRKKRCCKSKRG